MPYGPVAARAAARHFYDVYGATLWSFRGYLDAFNPGAAWTATDQIAIDQGPIVIMIENHRSGRVWDAFMSNPEIAPALAAMGFVPDLLPVVDVAAATATPALALVATPNPSAGGGARARALPPPSAAAGA